MANTSSIFNKTINEIIKEPLEFMNYVDFLSKGNIYNFSYSTTILVYGQKKESEYIAFFEDWAKVGRAPKKHTAIYIQDEPNFKNASKYLFALQDTYGQVFSSSWECNDSILDVLNNRIMTEEFKKDNFKESVKILTRTYVCDILKIGNDMDAVAENVLSYIICNRCNVKGLDDFSEIIKREFAKLSYEQRIDFLDT